MALTLPIRAALVAKMVVAPITAFSLAVQRVNLILDTKYIEDSVQEEKKKAEHCDKHAGYSS